MVSHFEECLVLGLVTRVCLLHATLEASLRQKISLTQVKYGNFINRNLKFFKCSIHQTAASKTAVVHIKSLTIVANFIFAYFTLSAVCVRLDLAVLA